MDRFTPISLLIPRNNSIFVVNGNEIYLVRGDSNNHIDKWILNTNLTIPVMNVSKSWLLSFY